MAGYVLSPIGKEIERRGGVDGSIIGVVEYRFEKNAARKMTVRERLERMSMPVTESGCRIWLGSVSRDDGYGVFQLRGKTTSAHRTSWVVSNGRPIPKGMNVLHRCDIPSCIEPMHLFIGTDADNVQDKVKKGRMNHLRGEGCGFSKLKEGQIIAIRRDNRNFKDIAKAYHVSRQAIVSVKSGATWAHIPWE